MERLPILCETCGYDLTGLTPEGDCPECGRAIASSLPENRIGSPWQRGRYLGGWWKTLRMLWRPRKFWSIVRIDRRRARSLQSLNIAIAAMLPAVSIHWFLLLAEWAELDTNNAHPLLIGAASALVALELWAAGAAALLAMTLIERQGIRFWGARRGVRITRDAATTICAHATYGWLLTGLGVFLVLRYGDTRPAVDLFDMLISIQPFGEGGAVALYLSLAAFPGLLMFEILVYLGVRGCRFANIEGSSLAPAEAAPTASHAPPSTLSHRS